MIPSSTIVDLSGPARHKAVRVIDGFVYGEKRFHPDGAPEDDDPLIVMLDDENGMPLLIDGEWTEVRPGRRWTLGEWTATKHTGCSCGGRNAALRRFMP